MECDFRVVKLRLERSCTHPYPSTLGFSVLFLPTRGDFLPVRTHTLTTARVGDKLLTKTIDVRDEIAGRSDAATGAALSFVPRGGEAGYHVFRGEAARQSQARGRGGSQQGVTLRKLLHVR